MSKSHRPWLAVVIAALSLGLTPTLVQARGGAHGGGMVHSVVGGATHVPMGRLPALTVTAPPPVINRAGMSAHQSTTAPSTAARHAKASPPTNTNANAAAAAAAASVITLPTPQTIPDTPPRSAIAAPLPEIEPIAPLSPQLPTAISSGGSTTSTLALTGTPSSTPNSTSPSEAAPSAPGGGGKTLADCMGFWDAATHMSKAEWKGACVRTMAEFPMVMEPGYLEPRR